MSARYLQNFAAFLIIFSFAHSLVSQSANQQKWLDEFNQDKLYVGILDTYHSHAGIDYGDGFNYSRNDIYASLINLKDAVLSFKDQKILASDKGGNGDIMEIGSFLSSKSNIRYYHVTAWRARGEEYLKELEYITEQGLNDDNVLSAIDESRRRWVDYSNQHSPADVVNEVYTSGALYYNNGKLSRGRAAIINRYDYMNNEKWHIQLIPVRTIQVNKEIAFEIGTYKSTGTGQYILIWSKDKDGAWRVSMDFNF